MENNLHTSVCDIKDLQLADMKRTKIVKESLKGLILDTEKIIRIGDVFKSEMSLALKEKDSSLQMENTYIPELPDGNEEGIFLALDIGGTNFRVMLLELCSGKIVREEMQHYHISDDLRLGRGENLFDYLAACCADFVNSKNLQNIPNLPLGFTFSFPMKQHALDIGELVTWTKSFNCPNVVGNDVVYLLKKALIKHGMEKIEVMAILNDTTGTLIQGACQDKRTRIGIILGTGTNAAFLESADRVKHWEQKRHGEDHVVIDTEWGAFGDNGRLDFMKTCYDIEVDNRSLMKKSFTFEKHIGGKYLGELMRIALKSLSDYGLLFVKADTSIFPGPGKFGTDNISQIELDAINNSSSHTQEILLKFGYCYQIDYDDEDIQIIQYVAALVSSRAARLVAICTAQLLNRMDDDIDDIAIAFDGSVYKHSPRIKLWIEKYIRELMPRKKFHLQLAHDGSGKGAAMVAAIALKIKQKKTHEISI